MTIRNSRTAALAAAIAALTLAACSGDGPDADADASATSDTSAPGPLDTVDEGAAPDTSQAPTGGGSSSADGTNAPSASPAAGGSAGGSAGDQSSVSEPVTPEPPEPVEPAVDADTTRFFFSYDESASTASRDLSLFALEAGLRPSPSLGRPYEFLNAERFDAFDARPLGIFEASMTLRALAPNEVALPLDVEGTAYALGVNLEGPGLPTGERRNVVLTLLVDVSGSMDSSYASETRSDVSSLLDVVKYGLTRIGSSLKPGDVVSLVTFSTTADVLLEGIDPAGGELEAVVASLSTESSTDIGRGVDLAYEVAARTYDPDKANRVVILTDARVNTGELDPERIAEATVIGGAEGILFSGVGVGSTFEDRVLDELTDIGRGTYSAMITPEDAERLFTTGFSRFVAPAATDVRFSLTYPQALDQLRSFAEEVSTVAEEVQSVNFSYDSDQFFLELFEGPDALDPGATITLGVEYTDPAGQRRELESSRTIGELLGTSTDQLDAALAVTTLAELIAERVDCEAVRSSALYASGVQDPTYATYRQNIDRFCDQQPPYRYLTR